MSNQITTAQIKSIAGTAARADLVAAIVQGWPVAMQKAKLTTKLRACHFLAEIMTETGGLRILSESGAYRYETILKIFGARQYSVPCGGRGHSAGIAPAEAKKIAALPVAQRGPVLFNRVYGVGNPSKMKEFENTGPNDGWLYRGGGMMQATGKSNYAAMAKKTGLPLVEHPELLHNPDSAFLAAYLEWSQDGRCNAAADRDDVAAVRKIINGGSNGLAECKAFLAKAKKVLAGYDATAPVGVLSQPDDEAEEAAAGAGADDDSVPEIEDTAEAEASPGVQGDPELFSVQRRLKAMNYSPGLIDGRWGGGMTGALGGFINDREMGIPGPTSLEMFDDVKTQIKAEMARAESEDWKRPVTAARANADSKTIAAIAPEIVPAKRNFWTIVTTTVGTFFAAIWSTITSWFDWAWDLFSDHKDDIPSTDSGVMSTAWSYVQAVPHGVWWCLVILVLIALAINAHNAVKKINTAVQTGARQ